MVDICLLASGSLVLYYCAIWCSSCTGKVFLCGASRQPPSLWNCFSNILFKILTGHISTAHSNHSSSAASRDSSKWSKTPQWHPVFFFVIERPLCLRGVEGWRQSDRVAVSVSSGPALSQVAYGAQINWTLLNSYTLKFLPFKKKSYCLCRSDSTSVCEFISHSIANQLLLNAAVSKLWSI